MYCVLGRLLYRRSHPNVPGWQPVRPSSGCQRCGETSGAASYRYAHARRVFEANANPPNPIVAFFNLTPDSIVGIPLLTGVALDQNGNMAGVAVIPTPNPLLFQYIIGPGAPGTPSPPFGTFGSIQNDGSGNFKWQNTQNQRGRAFVF